MLGITFGIGSDILSLPGLYLLFCEGVDLSEVLPQTCQPHADAAAPGHLRQHEVTMFRQLNPTHPVNLAHKISLASESSTVPLVILVHQQD